MLIRTGWSLPTYGLVVIGTGLAAGISYLLRETSADCADGYVRISATVCEESDARFAARILGIFSGINACLFIYYFLRNRRRRKHLTRLANDDPEAFMRVIAAANGVDLRLPQYEPDQATKGEPGWFYDPRLESRLRYWDGDSWTRWINTETGDTVKGRELDDVAAEVAQAPDLSPQASVAQHDEAAERPTVQSAGDIVEDLSRVERLYQSGELSEKSYQAMRQALVKMLEVKRDV